MKLMVLTAAVFPTREIAMQKLWIFFKSVEKAGVLPEDIIFYGTGRPFPGYRQMCLDWQLDALKAINSDHIYTHVLFSDSWDAFFTAPLAEIIQKYEHLGSPPILCSAYLGLGNESDMSKYEGCFNESLGPYRYPNRGGYIAEIPAIIEAFERMLSQPDLTGDDALEWYRGWREGWFRPQLDSGCEIFQVTDENLIVPAGMSRPYNITTNSHPCILHLSGGYTSAVYGKDDRMIPWGVRLGILPTDTHFTGD